MHGAFKGTVITDAENKALIINGQMIKIIESPTPESIDYTEYGINDALVIDSTGVFSDKEALGRHLQANGASKVLLTAPGKEIPNIVYGINQKEFNLDDHDIFSAASCTTNAISPVLKVIEDNFGIEKGHIETVHAYTNDQNLLDNMHSKPRRGTICTYKHGYHIHRSRKSRNKSNSFISRKVNRKCRSCSHT